VGLGNGDDLINVLQNIILVLNTLIVYVTDNYV